MQGITDIHTHILFGVDDGAADEAESEFLLKQAYELGERRIVLTPHYRDGMFEADADDIRRRFQRMKEMALEISADLKLYLGREIYIPLTGQTNLEHVNLFEPRLILIEFSPQVHFDVMRNEIEDVLQKGFTVIIAHLERYALISAEQVAFLRKIGCYIQVNATDATAISLFDKRKSVKKRAHKLLDQKLVDFIASDVHHQDIRPNRMQESYRFIRKKYGEGRAEELFTYNANCLLNEMYGA